MQKLWLDRDAAQEKALAQANARYELAKLEGKAGCFEHISCVIKDQNESLAKELGALRCQVRACVCVVGGGGREYFAVCDLWCSNFGRWRSCNSSCKTRRTS